jgi:hypothetical protein
MTELDKYIERKAEDLGTLSITDSPSEEYLKEICEGYYKIKQGQSLPIDSVSQRTFTVDEIRVELESIDEFKAAKYFFDEYGG